MDRRSFLLVGAAALGGCSSLSGSTTPTGTPTPTEASTETSTATPPPSTSPSARIRRYLEQRGITVERLVSEDGTVELTYETTRVSYQELGAEVGTVAGAYFREVADGWEVERLDAVVLRNGERLATWHAESAWLGEYQSNEITGEELSLRVLETLERV
jgi:hypothetical protein